MASPCKQSCPKPSTPTSTPTKLPSTPTSTPTKLNALRTLAQSIEQCRHFDDQCKRLATDIQAGLYLVYKGKTQEGMQKVDVAAGRMSNMNTTSIRMNLASVQTHIQQLQRKCAAAEEALGAMGGGEDDWGDEAGGDAKNTDEAGGDAKNADEAGGDAKNADEKDQGEDAKKEEEDSQTG